MKFLKRFFLVGVSLIVSTLVFAQKPTEPFSCYQNKSHHHAHTQKSLAAADTRSDSVDITHINVALDMTNWSGRVLVANAAIDFKSKVNGLSNLALDLQGLTVDSVKMNATLLSFVHNDTLLEITIPMMSQNDETSVVVFYQGQPTQNSGDWGGFYWDGTYAYNVGVSFLENPHNYGRVWFPCFDNFVERSTFEYQVKTDDTRKAFCNGLLQSEIDNNDGTKTWNWKIDQEIPSYLASVAVADYTTVEMDYNGIPIELGVRAADSTNLKNSFVHLPEAMEAFENGYAPYVFDRVGYCVTSFGSGAMEHATNITYMRAAVNGNTQWETLMAHELAHHWWGDNITCRTDADMWINEGWATYSEALFTEHVYGVDAYKNYVRENHESVLRTLHVNDDGYHPVAGVPHELVYSSTVYDKGGDMAHTLRGILGDEMFFDCIESFMIDNEFSDVSTEDMIIHFSDCSGKDVSSFFDTWIKEAGFHHFSLNETTIIDNNDGTYTVEGTITQRLRENNSMTTFLPIDITYMSANWEVMTTSAIVYDECSSFSIDLHFEPVFIGLDLEEKISDATVDNYQIIDTLGEFDFDLTRAVIDVKSVTDSSFVRVEHHLIKPTVVGQLENGMHISPNRFWTIDGVFEASFEADAIFTFNGLTNQNTGYLDNDFEINSEDSLLVLHRPTAVDVWSEVDSFTINTLGNASNKVGEITVHNIVIGDYVLAVRNSSIAQDSSLVEGVACEYTSIENIDRLQSLIKIFPNPSADIFHIDFLDNNIKAKQLKVYNILGKEIHRQTLQPRKMSFEIDATKWERGTYIVTLQNGTKQIFSQKIIVE